MKYHGIIKKSRTLDFAFLLAVLTPVEVNLHFIKDLLGDHYGYSFLVISIVVAGLRYITSGKVGDK